MNRVISYAMAIASACCAGSSYAQSLHGTVVGDDGKPLAAVVHFVPSTGGGGPLAYVKSASNGSFSLPNLAPGDYEVCIQVPGGGYTNPCQWPTLKVSYTHTASSAAPLELVAHRGSVVTLELADPSGLLSTHPTSPVIVGIFIPRGPFYPMIRTAKSSAVSAYSLTIPYNTPALLYISSPGFSAADAKGNSLRSTGQSFPLLQSSTAADPTFSFNLVGIKGN